jgi:hypothetical protein
VLVTRTNFDIGQRGERIKRETFRTVGGARGDVSQPAHYELLHEFGQARCAGWSVRQGGSTPPLASPVRDRNLTKFR